MWIAKYTVPKPEDQDVDRGSVLGVRRALARAINALGDGAETFDLPEVVDSGPDIDPECPM
jgi:hypothetical protein